MTLDCATVAAARLACCFAVLAASGCGRSHSAEAADPAGFAHDEQQCVSHWLAVPNYGDRVVVFENTPDGPANPLEIVVHEDLGEDYLSAVTTVDVDADGLRDVVVRNAYGGAALLEEPVSLTIIRASDAPFRDRERIEYLGTTRISAGGGLRAFGDWDRDGHDDLLAQYSGLVLLAGPELREAPDRCDNGAGIGDVDADGVGDSGCRRRADALDDSSATLWIYASSRAPDGVDLGVRLDYRFGPAGDVNGDGHGDVLVHTAPSEGTGHVLLSGAALDGEPLLAGLDASYIAMGDVNGDGFDDLAAARSHERRIVWGAADGPREAAEALVSIGEDDISLRAAGDANCDGFADVLVHSGTEAEDRLHLGGSSGVSGESEWVFDGDVALTPVFD